MSKSRGDYIKEITPLLTELNDLWYEYSKQEKYFSVYIDGRTSILFRGNISGSEILFQAVGPKPLYDFLSGYLMAHKEWIK